MLFNYQLFPILPSYFSFFTGCYGIVPSCDFVLLCIVTFFVVALHNNLNKPVDNCLCCFCTCKGLHVYNMFLCITGVYIFSKIYAPYGQAYKKGILHFFNLAVHFSKGTVIKYTETEYTPLYACTTLLMLFNTCTLVIFYFAYPKAPFPSS